MEGAREGDCRVPLISSIFCLCLTAGGILLGIYVFDSEHSKPWFPSIALTLIAMPWMFWVLMYFYTCMKACFRSFNSVRVGVHDDRQISKRSTYQSRNATMGRKSSMHEPPPAAAASTSNDEKHVKFGGTAVMEGESNGEGEEWWKRYIYCLKRK